MYKLQISCPDDPKVIEKIIAAASKAGAGVVGNYTECAFVIQGIGQWKSGPGAHPAVGKVGEMSKEPMARIEMNCPEEKSNAVDRAVRSVHPYEEPVIAFIKIENI